MSVLFGGNAVATHDIEAALYGTSLGVSHARRARRSPAATSTTCAPSTRSGAAASIAAAVEQGVLTNGLMHTLVKTRHAVRSRRLDP